MTRSGMPELLAKKTWTNFDLGENAEAIQTLQLIEMRDPFGAFIYGPAGCGKTHVMKAMANCAIAAAMDMLSGQERLMVRWTNASEYVNRLRNFDSSYSFEQERLRADILFVDDFGVTNRTEWAIDSLYRLLDYRCEREKQTFITSNLSPSEVIETYHERIGSRIKEMCIPIQLKGSDRRTKRMVDHVNTLNARRKAGQ